MPKKKIQPLRDEAREGEVLDHIINPSGDGEDPAVKAMLSDSFATADDRTATEIMLQLQRVIMGQASLLEQISQNIEGSNERLRKLEERTSKYDEDARRFQEDREKWFEEQRAQGERTLAKYDTLQRAELQAQGANMLQDAVAKARARSGADKVEFAAAMAAQPKVTIISPGKFVTVREGESIISKHIPEEVRIKHMRWVLPINTPIEVPKMVADVYYKQQRTLEEMRARQSLLSGNPESQRMVSEWKSIEKKFGTTGDKMPGDQGE